jgi:hypothetical protein
MNPMYFTTRQNSGAAQHWWIRHGGVETDSAPTNTAAGLAHNADLG